MRARIVRFNMKYPDDFIGKIIQGDCMDVMHQMPDKCVDLVLTDPPYGINYRSNYYKDGNPHKAIDGDDAYPVEALTEMFRIAKNGVFAFCRWDNLHEIPKPTSFLVWMKNNWTAGDLERAYGRQWEGIAFWPQEGHKFLKRPPDCFDLRRIPPASLMHPTEKPVPLLECILRDVEGKVVFDPYCGSGSTLEAAEKCGKKWIGIEIDPKYCEIARKRIAAEQSQGKLFKQ